MKRSTQLEALGENASRPFLVSSQLSLAVDFLPCNSVTASLMALLCSWYCFNDAVITLSPPNHPENSQKLLIHHTCEIPAPV